MKLSKKVKIEKGDFGYIRSQKKKRILITCCLFAITLLIYFTGLIQTKTRLNMFTFVAIMGCLPAGKSAVGMIMILMQKPISEEVYEKASKAAKSGTMFYELCFTTYEKIIPVDCLYISGSHVVGYASSEKADAPFLEKHLKEILKKNSRSREVKIFKDLKPFLDRVQSLEVHRDPKDPKFQTLEERNHDVKLTLLNVAL